MDNKQEIIASLSELTLAALKRCSTADSALLLGLHFEIYDAICASPDSGPLAGSGSSCAGSAIATLVADETQPLILAELRKQTELLTTLCQHQDDAAARHDGKSWRRTAKPIPPPPQPLAWDYDPITGTQSPPKTEEVTAAAKSQAGSAPLEFPAP